MDSDMGRIYDRATPDPTGSLSGPWIVEGEGEDNAGKNRNSNNVTGVAGGVSRLVCTVKNLGKQTVSWVRVRDTLVLTVGLLKFTPDRRVSAIHRPSSEDWVLEITRTEKGDQGWYMCQVSTTPTRSKPIYLNVAGKKNII